MTEPPAGPPWPPDEEPPPDRPRPDGSPSADTTPGDAPSAGSPSAGSLSAGTPDGNAPSGEPVFPAGFFDRPTPPAPTPPAPIPLALNPPAPNPPPAASHFPLPPSSHFGAPTGPRSDRPWNDDSWNDETPTGRHSGTAPTGDAATTGTAPTSGGAQPEGLPPAAFTPPDPHGELGAPNAPSSGDPHGTSAGWQRPPDQDGTPRGVFSGPEHRPGNDGPLAPGDPEGTFSGWQRPPAGGHAPHGPFGGPERPPGPGGAQSPFGGPERHPGPGGAQTAFGGLHGPHDPGGPPIPPGPAAWSPTTPPSKPRRTALIVAAAIGALVLVCCLGGVVTVLVNLNDSETVVDTANGDETPAQPVSEPDDPTGAPTAAVQPQSYSGTGAKVLRITKPPATPALATFTHRGSANFAVTSVDAHGEDVDLLVNTIGTYTGTRLVDSNDDETTAALKIQADGAWTVAIKPASAATAWKGTDTLSDSGDDVIGISGVFNDLDSVAITHRGSANFVVQAYGADAWDSLLVNEIGNYRGEQLVPAGTTLLEVQADGAWTLRKS